MLRSIALVLTVWTFSAWAQPARGPHSLRTKDGRTRTGVILSETQTGYLFKTDEATELVPFSSIDDLQPVVEAPMPPPAPPPPPPVEAPTPQPDPPPDTEPEVAPPPPEPPVPDWRAARKGFHWSLGLGGMVDPVISGGSAGTPLSFAPIWYVAAVPSVSWGFGWIDLHLGLQLMGYFSRTVKALFVGLEPQLRVNFAKVYSLGLGPYLGVAFSPVVDFALGASFSPAIFKIGDRGQHELALSMAKPFLLNTALSSITLYLVSYSYVF
jgi:hypothetical protein